MVEAPVAGSTSPEELFELLEGVWFEVEELSGARQQAKDMGESD